MLITQTSKGELVMYEEIDRAICPQCHKLAVVSLTPSQLAKQPDDTTYVCHPCLGGCNQGYAVEAKTCP